MPTICQDGIYRNTKLLSNAIWKVQRPVDVASSVCRKVKLALIGCTTVARVGSLHKTKMYLPCIAGFGDGCRQRRIERRRKHKNYNCPPRGRIYTQCTENKRIFARRTERPRLFNTPHHLVVRAPNETGHKSSAVPRSPRHPIGVWPMNLHLVGKLPQDITIGKPKHGKCRMFQT